MKRIGYLYEKLISKENALQAIEEVNKSHRTTYGKPNKTVLWVEINKEYAANELIRIIKDGYVPSKPKHRIRYDYSAGKNRDIYEPKLWPDQYVHHMVIQILQPVIMRGMDYWCCSSIKGRGTSYGIKGIKKWLKYDIKNTQCAAEADIYHFYDSLKPDVVMKFLRRLIKDRKMLEVIERLLINGIMIGAFFSQWFANMVLEQLDHMIREKLHIKRYIRYMDNITLFATNKEALYNAILIINTWLSENSLQLKPNWQIFYPDKRMIDALGYRFGRGFMLMRKKNLLRMKRCSKKISKKIHNHKKITPKQASGLISRAGMLKHCNACKIRKNNIQCGLLKTLKKIIKRAFFEREKMRQETLYKYLKRDYNIINPQVIGGKVYGISIRNLAPAVQ